MPLSFLVPPPSATSDASGPLRSCSVVSGEFLHPPMGGSVFCAAAPECLTGDLRPLTLLPSASPIPAPFPGFIGTPLRSLALPS